MRKGENLSERQMVTLSPPSPCTFHNRSRIYQRAVHIEKEGRTSPMHVFILI